MVLFLLEYFEFSLELVNHEYQDYLIN